MRLKKLAMGGVWLAVAILIYDAGSVFPLRKGRDNPSPIDIGARLELFVDDYLIEQLSSASRKLHPPSRAGAAIEFNAPWEGSGSIYVTLFQDGDRFRAYYRGSSYGDERLTEYTCYAESLDGVVWKKPSLGIHEFLGSKDNNIIWVGSGDRSRVGLEEKLAHNFAPFKDTNPAAPPEQRYKALAGGPLIALVSSDALHWQKLQDEPVITDGAFDSHNTAFWDSERNEYVAYYRDSYPYGASSPKPRQETTLATNRDIKRAFSADFLNWSPGEWLDYGPAPREHLYTNSVTPYFRAPHIYLGFPMRFVPGRKALESWQERYPFGPSPGASDAVFMASRDGVHWSRNFLEAFVRPGLDSGNWSDRNQAVAWGLLRTGPEEISLYWTEHYKHASNRLVRGVLRPDGFVSVNAPYTGGEILTKLLRFSGNRLQINFSTSAAGSLRIELQDTAGQPLSGFTLDDCEEIFGDSLERTVRWKGSWDLGDLVGQPVRMRIVIRDGDLYAFRFAG